MSIVCATHFTDSSNDAVHVAAALAQRTRQEVLLASVLPALQLSDALGHRKEIDVTDNLETAAQLLRSEGIKAEAELVHGAVDSALARLCARQRAQLLVVGDSSRGGRPLFGKPIDRLPYELSIPLLVVRSARPFEDWAQGKGPLRVLLAIDHTWRSELARNWIERLAEYGPLEVIATHVWSPDEEAARHGRGPVRDEASEQAMARRLREDCEAALEGLPSNVTHRVHLEIGRKHVAELLVQVAAREQADLIVLGTHPQHGVLGLLSSVSHAVLAKALMSVAFVPEQSGLEAARSPELLARQKQGFQLAR